MISKRCHYVINLGIVSNFYISVDRVYPGPLERYQCSLCVLFPTSLSIISIVSLQVEFCFDFVVLQRNAP